MLRAVGVQRPPNGGDVLRQVRLFHKRVRPHPLHQVIFLDQVAAVLHQEEQRFESLRSQRNRFPIAQQQPLFRINPKMTELINLLGLHGVNCF